MHDHFWQIESPNGPTSEGRCRVCGQRRTFSNSAPSLSQWTTAPLDVKDRQRNAAANRK